MKRHGREIHVVVDGESRGVIYVAGELSFREMARGACALRGVKRDLKDRGVGGWGFDGANFYVTTRKKRPRVFAPNFQWFVSPFAEGTPRIEFGPNPFHDLLK